MNVLTRRCLENEYIFGDRIVFQVQLLSRGFASLSAFFVL